MGTTIRLTEAQVKKLIESVISEQNTTVKRDAGFEKFPCLSTLSGYDLNHDGSVDTYTQSLAQTGESKQYYANGTMKWIAASGKITTGKYSCQGNKVVDSFIKNPTFKVLDQNTAFAAGYLPTFTKDGGVAGVVTKLQQALINKKFLNIKRPTGNYGRMTQSAVLLAAKSIDPANETNQSKGITKDLYDKIVGGQTA